MTTDIDPSGTGPALLRHRNRPDGTKERTDMALGLGVFLIVLGLVMATGVASYDVGAIPDTTLGWLVLAAGLVTVTVGAMANQQRARARDDERKQHR